MAKPKKIQFFPWLVVQRVLLKKREKRQRGGVERPVGRSGRKKKTHAESF
jgi:hypothetical protein